MVKSVSWGSRRSWRWRKIWKTYNGDNTRKYRSGSWSYWWWSLSYSRWNRGINWSKLWHRSTNHFWPFAVENNYHSPCSQTFNKLSKGCTNAYICQENLSKFWQDVWRLSDVVTGDESWFYHKQIGRKSSSASWVARWNPPPTVVRRSRFAPRTLFSIFF